MLRDGSPRRSPCSSARSSWLCMCGEIPWRSRLCDRGTASWRLQAIIPRATCWIRPKLARRGCLIATLSARWSTKAEAGSHLITTIVTHATTLKCTLGRKRLICIVVPSCSIRGPGMTPLNRCCSTLRNYRSFPEERWKICFIRSSRF